MIMIIILLCMIICLLIILLFKKNNIVIHNQNEANIKRGMEIERKRRELKEYLAAKYPYTIPPEWELKKFDEFNI